MAPEDVEGSNEIPKSHARDEPLHVVRFSTLSWYRHSWLTSLSSAFLLLLIFASLPSMRDIHMPGDVRDRPVAGEIIPGTDVLGNTGDSQLKHWKGSGTVYVEGDTQDSSSSCSC